MAVMELLCIGLQRESFMEKGGIRGGRGGRGERGGGGGREGGGAGSLPLPIRSLMCFCVFRRAT